MALKDWKKTEPENKDMGEIYQWDRDNPEGRVWIQKTDKSYWVNALNGYSLEVNRRYESEQKAIASAKRYMRTH